MIMPTILRAAAVAVSLALASPALAQPVPSAEVWAALDKAETADQAIVGPATEDINRGGFAGLLKHLPELEAVLGRAPASYPLVETRGEVVLVRSGQPADTLLALLGAAKAGENRRAVHRPNVYPTAALLLALYYNEMRQPEAALAAAERGLALQPANPLLASEKGAALVLLRRFDDSLAAYLAPLEAGQPLDDITRARLLRGKGFALIELKRLDEAQAAYEESLTLQPGHGGALHELDYIKGLRAGKPGQPADIFTGDEAAKGPK